MIFFSSFAAASMPSQFWSLYFTSCALDVKDKANASSNKMEFFMCLIVYDMNDESDYFLAGAGCCWAPLFSICMAAFTPA